MDRRDYSTPFVLKGELQETVAAVDIEFCGDIRAVGFDGAITDAEVVRNFLAGLVQSNELQDTPLCRGQVGKARLFRQEVFCPLAPAHKVAGNRRTEVVLSHRDRFIASSRSITAVSFIT